jgi:hypothetical protein
MQKLKKTYSLIFQVLLKYFVRIKKYSRGAGGHFFVIYGQPMESNIIISDVLLRCRILYLYTKSYADLNKGRYLKPSKSRAISFDIRLYLYRSVHYKWIEETLFTILLFSSYLLIITWVRHLSLSTYNIFTIKTHYS